MSSEVTSGVEFLTLYVTTLPIAVTEDLAITTDIPAVVRVPSLIINENDIKNPLQISSLSNQLGVSPCRSKKMEQFKFTRTSTRRSCLN